MSLHLALRAVCDACTWRGWLRVSVRLGTATLQEFRYGNFTDSFSQQDLVWDETAQILMVPLGESSQGFLTCPVCGSTSITNLGHGEPLLESSPCRFDATATETTRVPEPTRVMAEPDPEPRAPAYFYDLWCPHCTHVDTITTLRPNLGLYATKCPKCSRSYQVYLDGDGKHGLV